jgi:N6-adenosine-specific RNA methylase IME4
MTYLSNDNSTSWADKITAAWRATIDGIFEVGRLLIQAKDKLEHGEFQSMVERDLPFQPSTARRLMAIAADLRLSNRAHAHVLPASWGSLYELTKLTDKQFETAISRGLIHPEMQRKDIAPLRLSRRQVGVTIDNCDTCTVSDLQTLINKGMKFGTIYADPPWRYGNQATRSSVSGQYEDLSIDEICALPIKQLALDAAHIHMWNTNGMLFDTPRIFEAWGFEFKSSFVWVKPTIGIGNYWRNSHEFLLTGVRGDAKSFCDKSLISWMQCERGEHSAKPEKVRHMLERASPGPYLELFARSISPGWVAWGNDVRRGLFDHSVAEIYEAAE